MRIELKLPKLIEPVPQFAKPIKPPELAQFTEPVLSVSEFTLEPAESSLFSKLALLPKPVEPAKFPEFAKPFEFPRFSRIA